MRIKGVFPIKWRHCFRICHFLYTSPDDQSGSRAKTNEFEKFKAILFINSIYFFDFAFLFYFH